MAKRTIWSYSAISVYNACPRHFKLVRLDRTYTQDDTSAMTDGKRVHDEIACYIRMLLNGDALPEIADDGVAAAVELCRKLIPASRAVLVEQKYGVTAEWEPCDFYAANVAGRSIADAVFFGTREMAYVDWKTGNYEQDTMQLELTGLVLMAHYPQFSQVRCSYFYTGKNKLVTHIVRQSDLSNAKAIGVPAIQSFINGIRKRIFPASPCFLCRSCPVVDCEFKQ